MNENAWWCSSDRHRNENVRLMFGWYVFWQSSHFSSLMWKMRTLFSILIWWNVTKLSQCKFCDVTIQPLGGEGPFCPYLGNLLDLDCGISDAAAVSRVHPTPHPHPCIPSLFKHILHSTQSKKGLEDGLTSWCHLSLHEILPLLKEEVDELLCRTWAIYQGPLLCSTGELHILQQGCGTQKGSWKHTKVSMREAIP